MTMTLLEGRKAVITGGSRGLGAAIGTAFQGAGAAVAVLDLQDALDQPSAWHGSAAFNCDVMDETSIEAALHAASQRLGGIDIVVANAGLVPPWRDTIALDLSEWDRVFAVNVRGVAATIKHAVPYLKQRGGSIILMASINAHVSHPKQMLYTATKHAVAGIMRAAALDLGHDAIRVNALGPGPIATRALLERLENRAADGGLSTQQALAGFEAQTALGRMATAEEVAKTALFLASDLSSGITGRMLTVDAGLIP